MMTNFWVSGANNPQAKARLFCFPFAGGGTLTYHAWSRQLSFEIELRPVRLPGREGRLSETCYQEAIPLVRALASGLAPYMDLPFAFFGHSMGALLAFELARELRRRGEQEPFCLMVSGYRAPQLPLSRAPLHKLPESTLIDELRHYGGTPEIVLAHKELMEVFIPVIRADFAIDETYVHVPETPLGCAIHAFGGETDHMVSKAELNAWRQQTRGVFVLHMFPGGHFYLNESQGTLLVRIVDTDLKNLLVGSRMITRNFFEQLGLACIPLLERLEWCFVVQVFLRDVVIIQVDEALEGCR